MHIRCFSEKAGISDMQKYYTAMQQANRNIDTIIKKYMNYVREFRDSGSY